MIEGKRGANIWNWCAQKWGTGRESRQRTVYPVLSAGFSGFLIHLPENCCDLGFHFRKIVDNDIPDNRVIDPEIPVDDPVAESGHLLPGNIRVFRFDGLRDIVCRFADHFDCTPDRMAEVIVRDQIIEGPVFRYPFQEHDLVKDMPEIDAVILQSRSPRPRPGAGCTCRSLRP